MTWASIHCRTSAGAARTCSELKVNPIIESLHPNNEMAHLTCVAASYFDWDQKRGVAGIKIGSSS
jgi:hypothetical protein